MPGEIESQADQYGLPERTAQEFPSVEKLAEQLKAPQSWQGPTTVDTE